MTTNENIATDTVITTSTNNNENKNLEGNIMENNIENIATDTDIADAQTAIENNGIETEENIMTNEIQELEAQALEAKKAAAQAKNDYDEASRKKAASTALNQMYGADKKVKNSLNQIAQSYSKICDAKLALAYLAQIHTDYYTVKQLEKHNKKVATQSKKISAANEKIAIHREKLVAANDKLAEFNATEIVAAALAVLNGTITPVVAPVVVAPALVVETVDVDAALEKINTVVIAARDAANKEHMLKSVNKLAALRDEINATEAARAADVAAMSEIEAANFVLAEKLETEFEEILSCGGDDVEEVSEEDRIAAMSWNHEILDPEAFLNDDGILSSENFEKETETVTEEAPSLDNKTVVGTVIEPIVEEPKIEGVPAALLELEAFHQALLNDNKAPEEPKAEEKPVKVNPVAEARAKLLALMNKKAGKVEETVEKKGSAEAPKAPVAVPKTETAKTAATPKVEEPATLRSIKEETNTSYDPKLDCESAYMPKTMKLQQNAQKALYNAFHSETTDTHVSAALIWDTIGDETPEIIDPYSPYVAPKAERTERRDLNHAEYLNGDMALDREEEDEEVVTNPSCTNYDDIMAACGY